MLTREEVEQALPAGLKSLATQQFTDRLNNIVADPDIAEQVQQNFVSYASVLKDGRFKVEDYLNAVHYVSYKLMGDSNQDAFAKTFPGRYARLMANGTSAKDIASHVASYNKGKLVNLVLEQSLVPTWVLNSHVFQAAINVQFDLMRNAHSEKVRAEAANSILTHLKRPEAKQVNLEIGVSESSGLSELKGALMDLAAKQLELIESGMDTRRIAAQPLIEVQIEGEAVPNGTP